MIFRVRRGARAAVSHRGHLAGADMFGSVPIAGDFSTNARNDIVLVWFYNVISTGVRVLPERSGEIPHGRGIMFVCASISHARARAYTRTRII